MRQDYSMPLRSARVPLGIALGWVLVAGFETARAEKPTIEFAMQLTPIQVADVDYDRPSADELAKCALDAETEGTATSWVVRNPAGQVLRRFQDSNGDNKVDRWCYYKNAVEVYRDIDGDFNGKADEYRWLGSAGTRWAVDADEDGRVDRWKVISAEEVTAEVVAALRTRDASRFQRLLITTEELDGVGLGAARTEEIRRKVAQSTADFEQLSRKPEGVSSDSEWVFFGGGRPGVIAAGTDGNARDVYLYDSVSAVVETNGKNAQVPIGALVRAGDCWRLIDLPASLVEGEISSFFFASMTTRTPTVDGAPSESAQQLITSLDSIDQKLANADKETAAKLHAERADLLEKLAQSAPKDEERAVWYRQFADSVSAAVQTNAYPAGLERLDRLVGRLTADKADEDLIAYASYRHLMAQYAHDIQAPDADFAKVQEAWLGKLESFVKAYPKSSDAAEAMLQIAMAHEFSGEESKAGEWYARITGEFPKAAAAPKAAGAQRRLASVGKPFQLKGATLDGKPFDITALKGKTVIVHYWATWCEPCKQDLATLAALSSRYAKAGLVVVGVNLDTDTEALRAFLRANRATYPHIRDAEGLDGPLANDMGILTLPAMFVIDRGGRMVQRNAHSSDVEKQIEKLLK
ncbi:MAG: redoxin domain-containing protein [Planctomycetes bacterium]|nr:redoxin domain-containing protein [Planctomycetota bacterium]